MLVGLGVLGAIGLVTALLVLSPGTPRRRRRTAGATRTPTAVALVQETHAETRDQRTEVFLGALDMLCQIEEHTHRAASLRSDDWLDTLPWQSAWAMADALSVHGDAGSAELFLEAWSAYYSALEHVEPGWTDAQALQVHARQVAARWHRLSSAALLERDLCVGATDDDAFRGCPVSQHDARAVSVR